MRPAIRAVLERGAARLGARLRRHELDARRRAGRGRGRACRSRTSRPGCAAATSRCPRSGTGSRSTGSRALLLCPDERSRATLEAEGVAGRIEVVGDVMADACSRFAPIARERSDVLERASGSSPAATSSRRSTARRTSRAERLAADRRRAWARSTSPVVFPAHPRTRDRRSRQRTRAAAERRACSSRSATSTSPRSPRRRA